MRKNLQKELEKYDYKHYICIMIYRNGVYNPVLNLQGVLNVN